MTITTTGYGDFTAATGLGRMTAVLEAIFGQLYLITVVALVVQNLGQQSRLGRRMEEELRKETVAAEATAGRGRMSRPARPEAARTPDGATGRLQATPADPVSRRRR